jgi:threonyl-tRNA synthetase
MNAKIRDAQLMKIPYMLVGGDQEVKTETASLRSREGTRQDNMSVGEFVALVQGRIATRSSEL